MNLATKICTIGGGTGMPTVNRALISVGFVGIKSIVATFDSGGDSGRMRTDERGKLLAFSDYWRSLISLWVDGKQKEIWEEMLRFRDGRDRNFGNIFFQFMNEKAGDLTKVDELFSQLTGANLEGEVIPVSTEPADVCFETGSGKKYKGEHHLDELRMSLDRVEEIWLEPRVKANPEAIGALNEADLIVVCPGSMYGSIITNFLPEGMAGAYNSSKAKKILMTNIMSMANENDKFSQREYVETFKKYLKNESPFDLVAMVDFSKLDQKVLQEALDFYKMEHSFPIEKGENESNCKTIVADIGVIDEVNMRLRHGEEKLGKFFKELEI